MWALVIKSKMVDSWRKQVNDYAMLQEWMEGDSRIHLINRSIPRIRCLI